MKLKTVQLISIAVLCSILLGVTLWALYAEYDRPWRQYRKEFRQIEYKLAKDANIKYREEKIHQLWLRKFGIADRCITCHQGIDKPQFIKEDQPYKTHSGDYIKNHPVEKYGCVICHEGQGPALIVKAAHGEVKNWARPILKDSFAQSSCGKCHFMQQSLPISSELPEAAEFSYGWRLFQEYNCIGCHKLEGNKRPEYIGPPLTSIGSKVNKNWLISWLKKPKDYMPKTKMPGFNLSDEEIGYVADYLMSRGTARRAPTKPSPLIEGGVSNKAAIKDGEILINELGCPGCHIINNKGNAFAPDLSDIGNKVNAEWLFQWLKNPGVFNSKARMPDFILPEKQIQNIVAYLMTLRQPHPGGSPERLDSGGSGGGGAPAKHIEKGKKIVKDLGCPGCHEIGNLAFQYNAPELDRIGGKRVDELVFNNLNNVKKTLINWLKIKVMDPGGFATDTIVTRMPDYDFNEEQAEALASFLLSFRDNSVSPEYMKTLIDPDKVEMRGKIVFEKYNCLGCHRINKEGGDIGPDLTKEAKKSRPEWLFNFLKRPHKIRPAPILKARMPDFNLSDKETNTVTEYLSFVSEEPYPFNLERKREIYPEDVRDGEKLYQEVFACSGCHTVNGLGGEVGPEHTDLASRLKREWIEKWLQNPQAIKPDVRMPGFKFKDWEFEALTNYLMTLGKYRFVQVKSAD